MPTWLIQTLIGLAFFPGLLAGLCLLFLAGTWMQVMRKEGEENGETKELHA